MVPIKKYIYVFPKRYIWPAIYSFKPKRKRAITVHNRRLSIDVISSLMCSFNTPSPPQPLEVYSHTPLLAISPTERSRAPRVQETWLARRRHQTVKWQVPRSWLSNNPPIHLLRVLRRCLDKTTFPYWLRQCPQPTSPTAPCTELKVRSLYGLNVLHARDKKHTMEF